MAKSHIPAKAIENLWKLIEKGMQNWDELINNSFLSDENKNVLKELIESRANQLEFHLGW
jgi:serine/threonine-protein kinase HipA